MKQACTTRYAEGRPRVICSRGNQVSPQHSVLPRSTPGGSPCPLVGQASPLCSSCLPRASCTKPACLRAGRGGSCGSSPVEPEEEGTRLELDWTARLAIRRTGSFPKQSRTLLESPSRRGTLAKSPKSSQPPRAPLCSPLLRMLRNPLQRVIKRVTPARLIPARFNSSPFNQRSSGSIMATTPADASRSKPLVTQDSWQPPTRAAGFEDPKIKVYNSLTRTKVRKASGEAGGTS